MPQGKHRESFVCVGIYWNNHDHLLEAVDRIGGGVLWANLHLLFWLSLFPFAAGYLGENHFAAAPTALHGIVLLMAGVAYTILVRALLVHHTKVRRIARRMFRGRSNAAFRVKRIRQLRTAESQRAMLSVLPFASLS